jgi:hypothetical protein
MSKLFTIAASIFVIFFASTGLRAAEFSEIMNLMKNTEIELDFSGGTRPFKLYKEGFDWKLQQQENQKESIVIDKGNDKIGFDDFPDQWPINGTWKFIKNGNKCKITQVLDAYGSKAQGNVMTWKCNPVKVTKRSSNKMPLPTSKSDVGDKQKVSSGSETSIDQLEKQLKYLKARKALLGQIKELESQVNLLQKKLEILKLEFETDN